ncbi:MAG: relaxase domain-containing protein [Pirellulaceae bacterium]|nr:relaxase domain-containing protein [Pirellulaceae bacterium]
MRATTSTSATSSKRYFEISDYLGHDPNPLLKGHWFGKAAHLLGLEGEVDKQAFDRLVDNEHPATGERLTQRMHAGRRVGTDFTLSAPKSVSLLWAESRDDDILKAVQQAAFKTVDEFEKDCDRD